MILYEGQLKKTTMLGIQSSGRRPRTPELLDLQAPCFSGALPCALTAGQTGRRGLRAVQNMYICRRECVRVCVCVYVTI